MTFSPQQLMADRDIEMETMIRLDTLNSAGTTWERKSKEEKQEFISKLVESVIITKTSNNELHVKKINFRRSFVDMLAKLFGNGILNVLVPVEISGKEEFLLGTILIRIYKKKKTILGHHYDSKLSFSFSCLYYVFVVP